MKLRIVKLTAECLIQLLQGKTSGFASNLPGDVELLDVKFDLFSRQVLAVVRSDSFEDIADSIPIPEINLVGASASQTTLKHSQPLERSASSSLIAKQESKSGVEEKRQCTSVAKLAPCQMASKMENEFSPDQRKLLNFAVKGDYIIVKPIQFLSDEWEDINEVVRSLGGRWVKGDIISYWEIPLLS
jgi:hypothetical protein